MTSAVVGAAVFLRDRLAGSQAPGALVLLDELPLTPIGKVDKLALQERAMKEAAQWSRYVHSPSVARTQ